MFAEAATMGNPFSAQGLVDFFEGVLGGVMYMALPVIGLVLVYIGFLFISARGNREKVLTATRYFGVAVLGIALTLGSYAFIRLAYNTIVKDILGW